jgi:hypothetical protein
MTDKAAAMGEIIAFRPRETRAARDAAPGTGEAEILFFLGVRYCRVEEQEPAPDGQTPERDSGVGGGRKRRRRARA